MDEEDEEEYVGQRVEDMVRDRHMKVERRPTSLLNEQRSKGTMKHLPKKVSTSTSQVPGSSAMEQLMAFEGAKTERGDGPVTPAGEGETAPQNRDD